MTLEGTPDIVTPAGIRPSTSSTRRRPSTRSCPSSRSRASRRSSSCSTRAARRAQPVSARRRPVNECANLTGALPPIVDRDERRDRRRRHRPHELGGQLRTRRQDRDRRRHHGRLVTDIDLTISRATKDVVASTVNNVVVPRRRQGGRHDDADRQVQHLTAPLANRLVGSMTAPTSLRRQCRGRVLRWVTSSPTHSCAATRRPVRWRSDRVHEPGRHPRRHD